MAGGSLDRQTILERIQANPPLIQGFFDLTNQLQINGFDLTLKSVSRFSDSPSTSAFLGVDDGQRQLAQTSKLPKNKDGLWHLTPGPYLVNFNEIVNIPLDLMAFGRARSSLLRSGVALHTAVWDAGYSGRSQALLVVYNPHKFVLAPGTRIMQLVFFNLEKPLGKGYSGIYQHEGTSEIN